MHHMTRTVDDHAAAVAGLLHPLAARPVEPVPVRLAAGRRNATEVRSPADLPAFRNSQMDGYAVRAQSIADVPVTLPVDATVAAGAVAAPLSAGAAMKVMTGAPIPAGADCVVPVEDTTRQPDGHVRIERTRAAGEYVREQGDDVRAGALLVPAETGLRPRHVAALAAVGLTQIEVYRRVRAVVITTGDELTPAGTPLRPGQVYDSNGVALATYLAADGVEVVTVTHAPDEPERLRGLLDDAATRADLVLTSGGISMGDFEVVKATLQPLGGEFGHVAMQPGGPQGLSVLHGIPVLSFPGNPVSTVVSYLVFARPTLRTLAGLDPVAPRTLPLLGELNSTPGKRQFRRGRIAGHGVEPVAGPGSHLIAAMARADVLIDLPADVTAVAAGSDVRVWAL
ncbi:gephyrin-like molybdotransferase Glp [Skermania piniformis]